MAAIGVAGGFVAGILLSEIIGVIGFVLFGRIIGIRYLPIYLALAGAIAVPAVNLWRRHRSNLGA